MRVVLVCGGRNFAIKNEEQRLFIYAKLNELHDIYHFSALIEGGSTGADAAAAGFARWKKIPLITYRAEWDKLHKAAGPIRNQKMLDDGKPDIVIAFPGGRGTADMVRRARAAGIDVKEFQL